MENVGIYDECAQEKEECESEKAINIAAKLGECPLGTGRSRHRREKVKVELGKMSASRESHSGDTESERVSSDLERDSTKSESRQLAHSASGEKLLPSQ